MEVHRLKPMVKDYDKNLFNELYEKTEGLRRKLASEINPNRFRLTYTDILSWFDDKFIMVFNKYYHKYSDRAEILLAHLINSLRLFKCRILRAAYTIKFSQSFVSYEDYSPLIEGFEDDSPSPSRSSKLEWIFNELGNIISAEAIYLLRIMTYPPPFIIKRLNPGKQSNLKNKITDEVLLDYFGFPHNKKALQYIVRLRKEIDRGISQLRVAS